MLHFKLEFTHALSGGDTSTALILVKYGADFKQKVKNFNNDSRERDAMEVAIAWCNEGKRDAEELMQEFINRGYDVNKLWCFGFRSNEYNIYGGESNSLKVALKNGANPNYVFSAAEGNSSGMWTPLIRAAFVGAHKTVEYLLQQGAAVNQKASPNINYTNIKLLGSQTALSVALARGWDEIVKTLVRYGATQ